MKEIVSLIKKGNVVAFCGAGLSAESGIPTFRGVGGLWEKYEPRVYATVEGLSQLFKLQPEKLRDFIIDCYGVFLNAEPNFAHHALSQLEKKGYILGIITQNIDDFHFQSGSKNVCEVHGNVYEFVCRRCSYVNKKNKIEMKNFIETLRHKKTKGGIAKNILHFMGKCPRCKDSLKSGIVFFGQSLPQETLALSYSFLDKADTVLCIGASGVVYPAASLPLYAKEKGAKIINVNPENSSFDDFADFTIFENAVSFFKKLSLHL